MPLPDLTPEQRQQALDKAAKVRRERAELKEQLKHSGTSLSEVLDRAEADDVVGKMKTQGPRRQAEEGPARRDDRRRRASRLAAAHTQRVSPPARPPTGARGQVTADAPRASQACSGARL
jgi:hypothetical protein